MANDVSQIIPQLLAQGVLALREQCVMPGIVNSAYSALAGRQGSTIDVPVPSAITAIQVAPAAYAPDPGDVTPTTVPIALDQWYEAPFYLTDQEEMEVMDGTIPMQASEAIKALANNVDQYILGLYTAFYGYTGTAGTTPFASDTTDVTECRRILNNQLAPFSPRHMIIDADAEAAALNLRAFQDASWASSAEAIMNANLNRKLGSQWWLDQNVPTHTAGTAGAGAQTITTAGNNAAGETTIASVAVDSSTGTLVVGDIITFAGHSQTYVVTAAITLTTSGQSITIQPGLQVAVDGSGTPVEITRVDSHVVNLNMHRDAIGFANRPLAAKNRPGLGSIISSTVDPQSKLTLRLELRREHKRDRYSFDILYGAGVIRRELGCRLAG